MDYACHPIPMALERTSGTCGGHNMTDRREDVRSIKVSQIGQGRGTQWAKGGGNCPGSAETASHTSGNREEGNGKIPWARKQQRGLVMVPSQHRGFAKY